MEAAAKKISQELTARKTALLRVNNSIATSIEETLLDEFPDEYSDNGVKDWLKIQQDVVLVKKSFKGNAVPSRAAVKRIIEENYEEKILNLKSSGLTTKRQSSCTAIETKLASYGVEFPAKKRKVNNAMTVLQPLSLQEEQEQIRMETTLSMHDKKNTVSTLDEEHADSNCLESDHKIQVISGEEAEFDETFGSSSKPRYDEHEAADILLSFINKKK